MTTNYLLIVLSIIAAIGVSPGRVEAQGSTTGGKPGYRGAALNVYIVETSPWTTTESTQFGTAESIIEEAGGLGLNLSYAVHPNLAFFGAVDLSIYGDLSGYSIVVVGAEYRLPLTDRFAASVGGGIGRYEGSNNMVFKVGVFDAGIEFFAFRRFALDAGLQIVPALGDGRRYGHNETTKATLDSKIKRKRIGLSWYLGER